MKLEFVGSKPTSSATEGCQSGLSWWIANSLGVKAPQVRILYLPPSYHKKFEKEDIMKNFRVQAYTGNCDYDEGDRYNEDFNISLPKNFTKENVERMMFRHFDYKRVVVLKITEV